MNDEHEIEAMAKTLIWAIGLITQSGPEDRQHIALAHRQVQELAASIPKDKWRCPGSYCCDHSDACRAADDVACAGCGC